MEPSEFKERYNNGKTWGDASALMDMMSDKQVKELLAAMIVVGDYTGLDMRQDFFRGMLRAEVLNRGIQ